MTFFSSGLYLEEESNALLSGITLPRLRELYKISGVKLRWATCKCPNCHVITLALCIIILRMSYLFHLKAITLLVVMVFWSYTLEVFGGEIKS